MPFVDTKATRSFGPEKLQKLNLFETPEMFCDVYCLEPGQAQKSHTHGGASKLYYVLEGRARVEVGGEQRELGPGELAWARAGEPHGVLNPGPERLALLVAMAPNPNRPTAAS